ncbi:MAG: TolC family protein [Candidatus Caenarcaniphilales bacterium]|nr:TolC family protein [Candidatus Caenarcaniphilales bacterium]
MINSSNHHCSIFTKKLVILLALFFVYFIFYTIQSQSASTVNQKAAPKLNPAEHKQSNTKKVIQGGIYQQTYRDSKYEDLLSKDSVLVLDLQTVLQMIIDKNLSIDIEEYNVRMARDKLLGSTAAFLPSVSLVQDISRRVGSIQLFGNETIGVRQTSFQPRVEASFNLFQGGNVLFGWIADKNSLASSKTNLTSIEQEQITAAGTSYFLIQRYQAELEGEFKRLDAAELNLKEREIALELGDDIKLSVLLAKQEVEEAKARVATLKGSFYSESARLNELLNLPANNLIMPVGKPEEQNIFNLDFPPSLRKLLSQASMTNPSINSQKYNVKSERAKQIQSVSAFLPVVSVQTSTGYIGPQYNDLVNNDTYSLTVQYDALQNLGGTAVANYLSAKHSKDRSVKELSRVVKQIEQQITQSYTEVISGKENYEANKSALDAAREAFRQAKARLEAEVGTPYEMKLAQSDLADARANFYESLVNFKVAQLDLLKDLGIVNIKNIVEGVTL